MLSKIAWDNLWFNKRRTILLLIIIAVTFASINLYNGYVTYIKNGMTLAFIEASGNFQIAKTNYWNNITNDENNSNMEKADILAVKDILNSKNISTIECVLEITGLVGNQNTSKAFWGEACDNPEHYSSLIKGSPVFDEEECVILGSLLADSLGISDTLGYVTLLISSPIEGICLGDFEVKGISSSGIVQQDRGYLLASRKTINAFLGLDDSCSYMKVYLPQNENDIKLLSEISSLLPAQYTIKNWQEINPSYKQINKMNASQFFIISFILILLIFVCLTLSLITTFTERIKEFGTMEALGFTKKQLAFLMEIETAYLCLIGMLAGFALVIIISTCADKMNITIVPPGYSDGYQLLFIIKPISYLKTSLLIFIICICSAIYPIANILGKASANLIKRS